MLTLGLLYISSLAVGGVWTSAEIFEMWPNFAHHVVSKIQVPLFLWLLGTVAADLLILLYFFAALVGVVSRVVLSLLPSADR
jgi:hypothetical protein